MAHEVFMRMDGVDGPMAHEGREGWVRLIQFSHSIEQPMSAVAAGVGAGSASRATHGDFVILKDVDISSPKIAFFCCDGKQIDKITIEICDAAKDHQVYMRYELSGVFIRRVAPQLMTIESSGLESKARELVHLRYGRIQWTYIEPSNPGSPSDMDSIHFWDPEINQGG